MRNLVLILGFILLTGCAALQPLQTQPFVGDRVVLEISIPKMSDTGNFLLRKYRGATVNLYDGGAGCPWESRGQLKASFINSAYFDEDEVSGTIDVPAGRDVYVSITDSLSGSRCDQSARFKVDMGRNYKLDVTAHESVFDRCSSVLLECSGDECKPVENASYAKPESVFMGLFDVSEVCLNN